MAIPQKPKLLYQVTIERKRFFRRFAWALLATVAAAGALIALNIANERGAADATLLIVGVFIAGIVGAIFLVRALFNLWRALRRRSETLRLFDQGFVWTIAGKDYQYGWSKLQTYRDGGHGLYLGKRVLLQWGALKFRMDDDRAFKVTGVHGDLRQLSTFIGRRAAHMTGIYMGKMLRAEKPVKIHPQLIVYPGGVQVGKTEIHWSEIDVRLKNGRLSIYRKNKSGKFSRVRQYNASQVDNVGGFMEVATTTIRNHQRERFGV